MIYQKLLDRCSHISTIGMSNDEWLAKRRQTIGGSDAGAIMGMSIYGSPLTVYLQKKNLDPKAEASKAAHRGKVLEQFIRIEAMKDFPELEIETVPVMLFCPEHPFMSANIDGAILAKTPVVIRGETIEGLGGHEIKTSETGFGWSEDEIPDSYYCQVQHYMQVTALPWFVVTVYILADKSLHHCVIRRNNEFIARLITAEENFWENHINKDIMPAAIGIDNEDDMITGMFDGSQAALTLTEEEISLCRKHTELNAQIKELEQQKTAAAVDFKAKLVTRAKPDKTERKVSASGGGFSVSWSFYQKRSADSDALKKAGLFEQYSKVSECDRMTITDKTKVKGA